MSCFPLSEETCKALRRDAAIELSQVALHGTPDTLNVVTLSKVSLAMVVGLPRVAEPLNVIVGSATVRDEMAISADPGLKEEFNAILFGVRNNLEAEPPGIYLNAAYDNGLPTEALFSKPGFVNSHNAREKLSTVWRDVFTKTSVPALDGLVAQTRCTTHTPWTLASLPAPQKLKECSVGKIAPTKPGTGFRAYLLTTGTTPTILPTSLPSNGCFTGWMHLLLYEQLMHELLTPSFARYIC